SSISRSLRSLDSNPGIRIEPPWHVKDVPLAERRSAEGEGFEPPVPARARRFSRPVQSTALPPLPIPELGDFRVVGTPDPVFGTSLKYESTLRSNPIAGPTPSRTILNRVHTLHPYVRTNAGGPPLDHGGSVGLSG